MPSNISLITGGNRGIGKGLVAALLSRPDAIVVATVRNPLDASSKALEDLPKGENSRLIVVKLDAQSETDAAAAAEKLSQEHGLNHIDTVIANAGISKYYGPAVATPLEEVREHFLVNSVGPLVLFQAFWPLLQQSAQPKFIAISTGLGSIGSMGDMPVPAMAYGTSKAALNYIIRKLHFENESLIAFPISPGWVQTDMGNAGALASGMEQAPLTLQESVDGILSRVDKATRESMGGTFQSFDGTTIDW